MKNIIKFLLFNILLCSAPATQAMGSVRNFGARAFKAASASTAKLKMNAQSFKTHKQLAKPFGFKNGNYQDGYQKNYKRYAHTAAAMLLVKVGALYGVYDKVKEWLGYGHQKINIDMVDKNSTVEFAQHDYDAPIPATMKKILDKHEEELVYTVRNYDWLPDWMVKGDRYHDRIEGAKLFSATLQKLGYSNFVIPQKYRYITPSGFTYTISQKMNPSQEKITVHELKQLIQVVVELEWRDAHMYNFFKTCDGKIALIDTEKVSVTGFHSDNYHQRKPEIERNCLETFRDNPSFDNEAKEYIESSIKKYYYDATRHKWQVQTGQTS